MNTKSISSLALCVWTIALACIACRTTAFVALSQRFPSRNDSGSVCFKRTEIFLSRRLQRSMLQSSSTKEQEKNEASSRINNLKRVLLTQISEFRSILERDGSLSIDFGVKGGELNATNRAPSKIDYYRISKDLGEKADQVMETCNMLSKVSPISEPTKYFGNKQNGALAPLDGAWKLLYTTAADASFSKNSTRGDAKAQNIVNASRGTITNVIDFAPKSDGTEPVLKQLRVVIRATAVNSQRIALQFLYAKAVFTKFFFLKRRWTLYIPVPATFITRCISIMSRIVNIFRRDNAKQTTKLPNAYFDVMYLDKNLRIHKTGEDNLFVQVRDDWGDARPLLE